jgi:hypothetical protein
MEKIHGFLTLHCRDCGKIWRSSMNCGHRTCKECRQKWFGRFFSPVLGIVKEWPRVYFMTLTLKNFDDLQATDIKRLRGYFGKLRKRYSWNMRGGFYVIQATNNGKGWHLHLHILYDGLFISKKALSAAWLEITKTSFIVDVKRAENPRTAVRYILRDFLQGPRIRPEDFGPYERAFYGVRVIQGFGHCRSAKLHERGVCPYCGAVHSLEVIHRFPGSSDRFDEMNNWQEAEAP